MKSSYLRFVITISLLAVINATSDDYALDANKDGFESRTTSTSSADLSSTITCVSESSAITTSYHPASDLSGIENSIASSGTTPLEGPQKHPYATGLSPGRQSYPLFYNSSSAPGPTASHGAAASSGLPWSNPSFSQQPPGGSTDGLNVPNDCPPPFTVTIEKTITAPPVTVTKTSTVSINVESSPVTTPTVTLSITTTVTAGEGQSTVEIGRGSSRIYSTNGGGQPGRGSSVEQIEYGPSPLPQGGEEPETSISSSIPSFGPGGSYPQDLGSDNINDSSQGPNANSTKVQAPSFPAEGGKQSTGDAGQPIPKVEQPPNNSIRPDTGEPPRINSTGFQTPSFSEKGGDLSTGNTDQPIPSVEQPPNNSIPPDTGEPPRINSTGFQTPSFPGKGDGQSTGKADQPIPSVEQRPDNSIPFGTGADRPTTSTERPNSEEDAVKVPVPPSMIPYRNNSSSTASSDQDYDEASRNAVTQGHELPAEVTSEDQNLLDTQIAPDLSASQGARPPMDNDYNLEEGGSETAFNGSRLDEAISSDSGFENGTYELGTDTGIASSAEMPQPIPSIAQEDDETSSAGVYTTSNVDLPIQTGSVHGSGKSDNLIPSNPTEAEPYGMPPFINSTTSSPGAGMLDQPASGTAPDSQGSANQSLLDQTPSSNASDATQQLNLPTATSMDNLANQASSDAGAFYTTMTQEVVPYPAETATNNSSPTGIVSFKVYNNSPPTTTGGVSDEEDADDSNVDTGMTYITPANTDPQSTSSQPAQLGPESSSTPSDTPGEPLPTSAPTNSSPVKNDEPMESSQPPPLAPNLLSTPGEPLPTTSPTFSSAVENSEPTPSSLPPSLPSNATVAPSKPLCVPSQENRLVQVDFNSLQPSSPLPNPYESLTYAGFSVSPASSSSRLGAFTSDALKSISISPPAKHFNLTSISLACYAPPCNITMWGTKVASKTATGAAAGTLLMSMTRVEKKDEYMPVEGLVEKGWMELEKIAFTAKGENGEDIGVGIDDLSYTVRMEGGCGGKDGDRKEGVKGVESRTGEARINLGELGKRKRGHRRRIKRGVDM
ncbi:MAG: hypothetical protein Q9180_001016 [Flavoplaca navasiana]